MIIPDNISGASAKPVAVSCELVISAVSLREPHSTGLVTEGNASDCDPIGVQPDGRKAKADKPKDFWDKLVSVATLLIPAAVTLVGLQFTHSMELSQKQTDESINRIKLEMDRQNMDRQDALAKANSRLSKAQFISSLQESLISDNPQKRKLAIALILVADPDEGPKYVRSIATSDPNKAVQQYAVIQVNALLSKLVSGVFSTDPQTRITDTNKLIQNFTSDSNLVPLLLRTASQNTSNADGIYNATYLLSSVDRNRLLENRAAILQFLEKVEGTGNKTKKWSQVVRSRLQNNQ